jgi:hypothetical protein
VVVRRGLLVEGGGKKEMEEEADGDVD